LDNQFLEPDPLLIALIDLLNTDVNEFLKKFATSQLLVGLLVSGEEKRLVKNSSEEYESLAIFTTAQNLKDFEADARPSVMTGLEIAELAASAGAGLVEIDPPAEHRLITGSMVNALLANENWIDPAENLELRQVIAEFLKDKKIDFALHSGDWTDLKIYLAGEFELIAEIAPQLAVFLSQSEIALKYLPSGADILYSHG
jgi:hypothetical protein